MIPEERTARVQALAKINLALRVLKPRPDGYHELRTVYQTIALADELEFRYRAGRRSVLRVESHPEISPNLVERAAALLLEKGRLRGELHIRLRKRIPIGAGLGGGSSDAAAVLLTVPVLAGLRMAPEQLLELAARLGSDVPFFLYGGRALGIGRGCEVYPLPERGRSWCAVLAPKVRVATAEAYAALGRTLTPAAETPIMNSFQSWIWSQDTFAAKQPVLPDGNDFEPVIFRRHPSLARLKRRLLALGARGASLSGSGSAIFGLFETRQQAEGARSAAADLFVVPTISRAEYRRRWRAWLARHATGRSWPPQSRYSS